MSTFGDNVARLRAERGLSQRDLADALKISKGTIGAWETKNSLPDWERMQRVTDYFGVSIMEMFTPYIPARDDEEFSSEETRVFGRIAAGTPIEMEEGDYGFPCPTYLKKRHPKAFFLEVDGESMNRVIPNHSLVLVDPTLRDPIVNDDVYAVCVNGHDATVKRVAVTSDGLELIPDSTDKFYQPIVYGPDQENTETVTVIGKVVWFAIPFDFDI